MSDLVLKEMYYDADKTEIWRQLVAERQGRLEYAATLKIPHIIELEPHPYKCAIVGGAPSIKNHIEELKTYSDSDITISLNGAHNYLIEHGVTPRIHPLFEIDLKSVEESTGGPPNQNVYYYVCSHCSHSLFRSLKGYPRVLWHCFDEPPEYQALIAKLFPGEFMIGGGFVTFFRAINIASILGYRDIHLYGCDCSFDGDTSHYEGYQTTNSEVKMVVAAGTKENYRVFNTTPSLSFLAREIMRFCDTNQRGIRLTVHGDGLLRHLHQMEYPKIYEQKE